MKKNEMILANTELEEIQGGIVIFPHLALEAWSHRKQLIKSFKKGWNHGR